MNKKNDALDEAVSEISGEAIDPRQVEEAAARVWQRLTLEASGGAPVASAAEELSARTSHLGGCEDFQALIPAYLRGELSPARALLVEDHTRGCVPCRRALREAREGRKASAVPVAPSRSASRPLWMSLAALLVLGLGAGLFFAVQEFFLGGQQMARIEAVEGSPL